MTSAYFDNNATTPIDPEVFEAMEPFLRGGFGNPSSPHSLGRAAREALENARHSVARLIGAEAGEIIFTSCGTESNNAAIASALQMDPDRIGVVTTQVEHSAVLKPLEHAARRGGAVVTRLPVSNDGIVDCNAFEAALDDGTALASVMWANNETGVISPIARLAAIAQAKGVLFHTDAVQAVGKVPISVADLPIHFLSISGHKLYAPKGIGALYVRSGTRFHPLLRGGGQENERRGGTENVALAVALGKACDLAGARLDADSQHVTSLRDRFEQTALEIPGVYRNGHPTLRLAGTSNLTFEGVDSEAILLLLDQAGFSVSAGSACTSGSLHPSHVLTGMGLPTERARGALRFSFGRFNTLAEIERLVETLPSIIAKVREMRPKPTPTAGVSATLGVVQK